MNYLSQEVFNWAWIILFIIIVVVRKIHERKAGELSSLKKTPFLEAALMLLWGVASGVLPFFYIFGPWLDFADFSFKMPPALGVAGIIIFLISIWLLHRSHADLGKLWSSTVEPEAKQALIIDGIFKYIRHPMYSAHVLWGIAQILLLPNLIAGPLALVLIFATIALRIPREEQALLDEFGDTYREYMQRTGRIFPKM